MAKLSHYVRKTKHKQQDCLFNTVNKKILPVDASASELEQNFFLAGQEQQCMLHALQRTVPTLMLTIIPTWQCNLRCSHCSVLHLLQKKQTSRIDTEAFQSFMSQYLDKYTPRRIIVMYLGGESMLEVDQCLEISNILTTLKDKYKIQHMQQGITTNLAFTLTEKHIEFFQQIYSIQVSIDGNKKQHNEQRHHFDKSAPLPAETCYDAAILNLNKLIRLGLRDKVEVQAALKDEYCSNLQDKVDFYVTMLRIGVHMNRINYFGLHPTVLKPEASATFERSLTKPERWHVQQCCKFRYLRNLQINPDNTVYDNFYIQEFSKLGTLFDDITVIEEAYAKNMKSMPVLHDPVCQSCPVIGYCWGGCINGYAATGVKPSQLCNQQVLIKKVNTLAESGELITASGF